MAERLSHYTILEEIGAGGMGVVYRARADKLDRDVAIKVLPEGLIADAEARAQLHREARSLAKLNHPNIAAIFDFDSEAGKDFIVMEWVGGPTLDSLLSNGPIPESKLLQLALQIAEGLAFAHSRGIVHRDLKPANLRLTPEGQVKILDFGLARRTWSGESSRTVTYSESSSGAGTLAYMPPESFDGRPGDERGDLYSLGVVLYELASGVRPFDEPTPARLMHAILNQPVLPLRARNPSVSPGLESLVLQLMKREVAQRPVTAAQVIAWLHELFAGRRATAFTPSKPSLAVLPLENLSGDPAQEYFADGMTEALIGDLARLRELRVISRTSVMRYKGARRPIPEIAAELRVENVLEGSVLRGGDRIRVNVQLIEAQSDTHLWAERYDRAMDDILELQSEVAKTVAREIRKALVASAPPVEAGTSSPKLASPRMSRAAPAAVGRPAAAHPRPPKAELARASGLDRLLRRAFGWLRTTNPATPPPEPVRLDREGLEYRRWELRGEEFESVEPIVLGSAPPPAASRPSPDAAAPLGLRGPIANAEAYDAYLRGLANLNQRDDAGLQRAAAEFLLATKMAPTYLPALTGLAEALAVRGFHEFEAPHAAFPLAKECAERALSLDPAFGEAHSVLGYIQVHYDWNSESAERSFQRAIELNPSNAIAHLWYYNLLITSGRFDEALIQAKQGLELDPFSHVLRMAEGWMRFYSREFEVAATLIGALAAQEKNFYLMHFWHGWSLRAMARKPEAAEAFAEASECAEFVPNRIACQVFSHAMLGEPALGRELLGSLEALKSDQHVSSHAIALGHLVLGNRDEAFRWLDSAIKERSPSMCYLEEDPRFDELRGDPRFDALLARLVPQPVTT